MSSGHPASVFSEILWADLERDVIDVSGSDALAFLHSQLANDVNNMTVGDTVHSLLLEPTGHVVALVRLVRHSEDGLTIDVERGYGEAVIKRLSKFVLRAKVSMSLADKLVRAYRGNNAETIIRDVITPAIITARPWWDDVNAIDVVGPVDDLPIVGTQSDPSEIDAIRADAGWPRMGIDIEVGDIPAATGVIPIAVSFSKGCYPGQELVERMDSRGTVAPIVLRAFSVGEDISEGDVRSRGARHILVRVKRSDLRGEELQSLWH